MALVLFELTIIVALVVVVVRQRRPEGARRYSGPTRTGASPNRLTLSSLCQRSGSGERRPERGPIPRVSSHASEVEVAGAGSAFVGTVEFSGAYTGNTVVVSKEGTTYVIVSWESGGAGSTAST